MKIIASSRPGIDIITNEFNEDGEKGLIVLPEDSFTNHNTSSKDREINSYKELSKRFPVTIIGTKSTGRGYNLTYLIQNGVDLPVYVFFEEEQIRRLRANLDSTLELDNELGKIKVLSNRTNLIYPIQTEDYPLDVIIRECSDVSYVPTVPANKRNTHKTIDLLVVPCNVDQMLNVDGIFEVHKQYITPKTLLVQAMDKNSLKTGVYNLRTKEQLGVRKDGYTVYDFLK